jgi:GNAT superfamily N-acetyltransferase
VSVTIRRAVEADVEAAWEIVDEYFHGFAITVADDRDAIRAYFTPPSGFWLAVDGGAVVGCVALRPLPEVEDDAGEVKRLYVRASHRGRGLARALMDAAEEFARGQGFRALYLDTKDDLIDAIRFYTARGYEHIPRYNDNPQATIFMRRLLVAAPQR